MWILDLTSSSQTSVHSVLITGRQTAKPLRRWSSSDASDASYRWSCRSTTDGLHHSWAMKCFSRFLSFSKSVFCRLYRISNYPPGPVSTFPSRGRKTTTCIIQSAARGFRGAPLTFQTRQIPLRTSGTCDGVVSGRLWGAITPLWLKVSAKGQEGEDGRRETGSKLIDYREERGPLWIREI